MDTHTWGDYTNRPHDIKTLAKLIETVTEASRRRGKLSLFRTWTQTEIDLHSRKDLFQRLVETLPAEIRQNTIFSIKRTLTDFWYHQPVNPTLSCQGSERMIEFECRHEFEGMGIFPAYWGKDSKEAVKYAIRQGVKHMWFWPDAGGWVTPNYPVILPYVSGFDFWIDANVFQIYRLIWDPEESDEKTALDFGTLALGCEAGEGVAKILQMSYEACSRIFYTLPFAKRVEWKTISPCWHMPWLGVDPREIERVLDTTGESVAELLEESAEGVEWAIKLEREVLRLSANSGADQATLEQMRNSAFHLRKFAELMHAFRNLFCSREENINEVQENILRLRDCLGQYKSESNMVITEGFEKYLEQLETKVRRA